MRASAIYRCFASNLVVLADLELSGADRVADEDVLEGRDQRPDLGVLQPDWPPGAVAAAAAVAVALG